MRDADDLYDVLQVDDTTGPKAIEAAFKRLARRHHPDVNASRDAKETMQRLNDAYAVLRDPEQRAAYNRQRCERPRTGQARPAGAGREPRTGRARTDRARGEPRQPADRDVGEGAADDRERMSERLAVPLFLAVLLALSGAGGSLKGVAEGVWSCAADMARGETACGAGGGVAPAEEIDPDARRAGGGTNVPAATTRGEVQ